MRLEAQIGGVKADIAKDRAAVAGVFAKTLVELPGAIVSLMTAAADKEDPVAAMAIATRLCLHPAFLCPTSLSS